MTAITVAVPALNEERNLPHTIAGVLSAASEVPGLAVEVIVVDDGSRDATAAVVTDLARHHPNLRLLRNPRNLGLGASIRRAIAEASGERFAIVPADNDLPPATLAALFRSASAADVVLTYFHNEEVRGRLRYLISDAYRMLYTTLFDLYLLYVNGPAVYPTAALRALPLRSRQFAIVAEINVRLLRQGLSFVELPARRQNARQGRSLSLRSLADAALVLCGLLLDVHVRERARYAKRPVRIELC